MRLPGISTARYFCTELLTGGEVVPVRGSMFEPVVPLPYELEVAPSILPVPSPDTLGEWHPLRAAYWRQLDRTGLETVAAELREISERHGGKPLAICDYEDVTKGHRSPRVVFARWWQEATGEAVVEMTDDGRRLSHGELHKQVRGRPRVAGEPLPRPVGLSWPPSRDDLARFFASVPWREARDGTNPHSYCLRRDAIDRDFEIAVLAVREFGCQRRFKAFEYTHLDMGGFTHWSMGDSLPTTLLINRKPLGRDVGEEIEVAEAGRAPALFGGEESE